MLGIWNDIAQHLVKFGPVEGCLHFGRQRGDAEVAIFRSRHGTVQSGMQRSPNSRQSGRGATDDGRLVFLLKPAPTSTEIVPDCSPVAMSSKYGRRSSGIWEIGGSFIVSQSENQGAALAKVVHILGASERAPGFADILGRRHGTQGCHRARNAGG